ncbi:MAG: hypothetical protein M1827_005350 [Pycnora praestabilis]|nr:MAG: hypothetical protein M1827_005350 [Pycnora praestabilis]
MSLPPPKPDVEEDKVSLLGVEPENAPSTTMAEDGVTLSTAGQKLSSKFPNSQRYLDAPVQDAFRTSSDNLSNVSMYSADNENERRFGRSNSYLPVLGQRHASLSPGPPKTWRGTFDVFWLRNKGLALVLLSQFFGALMNVTTRLLETENSEGQGMHPLQILFARMGITVVLASLYMWYSNVPHFPLGKRETDSLLYLPVAEAIVITFLAPIVACWACSFLINEPFTRMEQIAGLVSLLGVVLIARPASLLSGHATPTSPIASGSSDMSAGIINGTNNLIDKHGLQDVTSAQRLSAVGAAMLGVVGAAFAYTTIRWIGKRAHALISVNYFAVWCTIVSTVGLLVLPGIGFRLPASAKEWAYLFFLGICGFVMQFLLTAGLQHEKSSRATNMVYTQMLFALTFDKIVWDSTPGVLSILGSSLILGSAIYVAVQKDTKTSKTGTGTGLAAGRGATGTSADEERGLMRDAADAEDDEADDIQGRGPLRGVQEVQLRTLRV